MRRHGHARVLGVALALVAGASGCGHLVVLHDPLSAAEHNDLGVAYEAQGRPDLARAQYRRALKADRRLVRARINLGNVEAARGKWGAAEHAYRRALRDDPASTDAMNNLATALVRRGRRLDEARLLATRAVAAGGGRDSIYRATLAEADSALAASRAARSARGARAATRGP